MRLWYFEEPMEDFRKAVQQYNPISSQDCNCCAVLHNFCIWNGDWDERDKDDHNDGEEDDTNVMQDGDNIREVLKQYVSL